jgi:hypothetical protein
LPTTNARLKSLFIALLASASVGCGNPITIATWLNLEPGSQVDLGTFGFPIEGGVFARIEIDLVDLLNPTGTIVVEQVRIGGFGPLVEYLCLRKDVENAVDGSFHINLLAGTQDVEFPFATIASSTFFDFVGIGELANVASPEGVEFPLHLNLDPFFATSKLDGILTLPVALDQDFVLGPGQVFPAVVDLVLAASASPPSFENQMVQDTCEPRWALQDAPLSYVLNPKSTYLHHVNEEALQEPLVIDLADVGALPGDTLEISTGGKWTGFFQTGFGVAAVFSSSDELLPVSPPAIWTQNFWGWWYFQSNRVAGAIEAGTDVVTPHSFGWLNRTDIPQDFGVPGYREIVVPAGAEYLFVTPLDNHFSDNLSTDLRISLAVVPQ